MKRIVDLPITSNGWVLPDHFLMQLDSSLLAKNSKAGQFVMVKVQENLTDPLLRIPLSIHSIEKDGISLLYKVVGLATKILSSRKQGEKIGLLGPLGNGFNIDPFEKQKDLAVLVAGGCGVAPLYALAKSLAEKNKEIVAFIGATTKRQVLCVDKFMELGAKVYVSTNDGSHGDKGNPVELLGRYLDKSKDLLKMAVYASGPNPMLEAIAKIANRLNVSTQLCLEAYMACGIGACYGCAINTKAGYKLCCKEGPVFDANLIES